MKTTKAKVDVNVRWFDVPEGVYLDVGDSIMPRIPLKDLDAETLDKLCEQFRDEVFRKAGKEVPARVEVLCKCPNCGRPL